MSVRDLRGGTCARSPSAPRSATGWRCCRRCCRCCRHARSSPASSPCPHSSRSRYAVCEAMSISISASDSWLWFRGDGPQGEGSGRAPAVRAARFPSPTPARAPLARACACCLTTCDRSNSSSSWSPSEISAPSSCTVSGGRASHIPAGRAAPGTCPATSMTIGSVLAAHSRRTPLRAHTPHLQALHFLQQADHAAGPSDRPPLHHAANHDRPQTEAAARAPTVVVSVALR